MSDPEGWLSSKDAPAGMREMLESARSLAPSTAERAALAGKVGVSTSALWLATSLKVLSVGLVAGAGWVVAHHDEHQAEVPPAVAPSSTAVEAQTPGTRELPPDEIPEAQSEEPQVAPIVEVAPPLPKKNKAPIVSSPQATEVSPAPPSEASLIRSARAALASSPERALSILQNHERLYPAGVLEEEREVLKLRALKASGKKRAAQEQERKFKNAHPDSVHHLP